jgi:hypothetical protein
MVFTLFPNPVTEEVTINYKGARGGAQAEIYDVAGKLVRCVSLVSEHTTVSLKGLRSRLYVCKFYSETATATEKLIIK